MKKVKGCIESMSRGSYINIMLGAKNGLEVLVGVSVVSVIYSLF